MYLMDMKVLCRTKLVWKILHREAVWIKNNL